MLWHLDTVSARLAVATLACCILGSACSQPDSDESGGASLSGFVGFLLANVVASEESEPADADTDGAPDLPPSFATQEPDLSVDEEPTSCKVPYNGPVTIVAVRTPAALARAMADRGAIPIVYSTEDTAIYEDGRVMTSSLEAVGDHLNAVGWVQNPMRILGAGTSQRTQVASSEWRRNSNSSKPGKRRKKRRRG